jgi:hypothetical protein
MLGGERRGRAFECRAHGVELHQLLSMRGAGVLKRTRAGARSPAPSLFRSVVSQFVEAGLFHFLQIRHPILD